MGTDSFPFHFALVQSAYPEFCVGGGQVGANSVFRSHVDSMGTVRSSKNLGQTSC